MLTFTIRRLVLAVPTLLFISLAIFLLLELAPGDPMAQVPLTVPPEVKEKMREALGLGEQDRIDTRINEGLCCFACGNVSRDKLDLGEGFLYFSYSLDHASRVSVSCVDHQYVDAGLDELTCPVQAVLTHTDGRSTYQSTVFVLGCVGEALLLLNIFNGQQPMQNAMVIDDQKLFNAVLLKSRLRFIKRGSNRCGHQVAGHDVVHLLIQILLESKVPVGDDTHQFSFHGDGQAADMLFMHDVERFVEGGIRGDRHRVHNQAALIFLYPTYFHGLSLG